jgi:hypothetical protein
VCCFTPPTQSQDCAAIDTTAECSTSTSSLLRLPAEILSRIATGAAHTNIQHSLPLLSTSRDCRNLFLSSIRSITLDAGSPDQADALCSTSPYARLLSRACCLAAPGLNVNLSLRNIPTSLPDLLEPAASAHSWNAVHSLEVGCSADLM